MKIKKHSKLPLQLPARAVGGTGAKELLVVAIGASAGGIESGIEMVRGLDPKAGMAYVFIQHLDPTHSSMVKDILGRETSMPVAEVTDGMSVEPNHIYVIPSNALMTIEGHVLRLSPRESGRSGHMPIDHFMRALAGQLGNRAVGAILSGTGTDGVLGMAEIQARGGVTFAQDEASAKYPGMPRAVMAAGYADYVMPPRAIAREFSRVARHPYVAPAHESDAPALLADSADINSVFQLLRRATRVDFTYYRKTTILRRIQRRMLVHKIEKLSDYVRYLQSNSAEIKALYQDMLIHVTSFFRNPKVFDLLKTKVFPSILKKKGADSNIRIWVPGCASGEEAYSIAISLLESLDPKHPTLPIQIFGTDIGETSIKTARGGQYPANIQGDISPDRLRRFFSKVDGGYRVNKNIREMCIFAQHNLLSDPPFSRMDLICCRNLLIYFEPVLQARVVSEFHYALRSGGYLLLGTSEGVSAGSALFNVEDRENKVFSKKAFSGRPVLTFSMNRQSELTAEDQASGTRPLRAETNWNNLESQKDFDRRLLTHYVPPTAFINEDLELVHTRGRFNRYFRVPSGRPTLNILKMAHEDLMLDLQSAILLARKGKRAVHRKGLRIRALNGHKFQDKQIVGFEVVPLRAGMNELYFMIIFQEEASQSGKAGEAKSPKQSRAAANNQVKRLKEELATLKEHLQTVVENQDATTEELQSANEEILSSNEELQSTNEELETAKEELQSTNEELSTVNDELRNRNLQISEGQRELRELLTGINVAVVGKDSKMRELAPYARNLLGLLPDDVGDVIRQMGPISEISDFRHMAEDAADHAKTGRQEVMDRSGKRYLFRAFEFKGKTGETEGHLVAIIDSAVGKSLTHKPPDEPNNFIDDKESE